MFEANATAAINAIVVEDATDGEIFCKISETDFENHADLLQFFKSLNTKKYINVYYCFEKGIYYFVFSIFHSSFI